MKPLTQTRRVFLACIPILDVLSQKLSANDSTYRQKFGGRIIRFNGNRNGYPMRMTLEFQDDGVNVARFTIDITARSPMTIQNLLESAGLRPVGTTEFPAPESVALNGRYYLVQIRGIAGTYTVTVNGNDPFEDEGIGEKIVYSGHRVSVTALPGARLA